MCICKCISIYKMYINHLQMHMFKIYYSPFANTFYLTSIHAIETSS